MSEWEKKFKVFLDMIYQNGYNYTGHKIAPNTVTNVTKIIALHRLAIWNAIAIGNQRSNCRRMLEDFEANLS